jgi:AraC-like DNA-binding protein
VQTESGAPAEGAVPDVDTWRGLLRDAIVELDAEPAGAPEPPGYTGWVRLLDLGSISVTDVASDPVRVARTPRLIRRNPVDFYHLSVARRPGSWAAQGGRPHRLRPGDAVLFDAGEPWSVAADDFGHYVIVNVPRADLERDLGVQRALLGKPVPRESPTLRVLMAAIAELGRHAPLLPDETLAELGHTAGELLVSTLRLAAGGGNQLADPRLSRNAQLLRMRDFVRRHLAEPDLSPRTIAAAFGVSLRYVEVVFAEGGVSPSRFIRETRLTEARRMLGDPRQRHRSIGAIARSVGIENPGVFARSFRRQFDITPRDYRHAGPETALRLDAG